MQINKLSLQNFRNYSKKEFEFQKNTIIVGENGAGKTNILEAIYLLATGKSFRADRDDEMIAYEQQFSILKSQISNNDQATNLQITITDRKKFEVNGIPRRQIDFVGKLKAVLFAPQDLDLITGSPGNRRRYLDFVICQMDREYHRCLVSYEKGLRQRNKLLSLIRDGFANKSQLYFWDKLLIKNGEYLATKREEYLTSLNTPSVSPPNLGGELKGGYTTYYDRSLISEDRLKQYEIEEVAAATTLVGPHRDDFVVNFKNKDVSKYGSRGEQRMAVLWLKKNEVQWLKGTEDQSPLLLLDDIFSELDQKHREAVMEFVEAYSGQVIATSTERPLNSPHNSRSISSCIFLSTP